MAAAMPRTRAPRTDYQERLHVPLRWWALATMFLASLLVAFLAATPEWVAFGAVGLLLAGLVALFRGYGSARLSVRDGVLRAGRANIPVDLLGAAVALDATATRRRAGIDADARAYLLLRPYVKTAVFVPVEDPDDPAPYWLLATRHPDQLVAALGAAQAPAR